MTDDEAVLRGVLDIWQKGIAAHRPEEVAAVFAPDAIFQGLHPYSVGRPGVAAYYDSQPLGMTVDYRIRETRRPAADVVLGWVEAEFQFTDRAPLPVNLTVVVLGRAGDDWQIGHYHVSVIGT